MRREDTGKRQLRLDMWPDTLEYLRLMAVEHGRMLDEECIAILQQAVRDWDAKSRTC